MSLKLNGSTDIIQFGSHKGWEEKEYNKQDKFLVHGFEPVLENDVIHLFDMSLVEGLPACIHIRKMYISIEDAIKLRDQLNTILVPIT